MDFPAAIQAFQPDTQDYIAVLTRGHRHDADCLTALSHCPVPTYLGMIGSRRRVKELKAHLEETEHLSHEWLESIHTPIGLAIKAVTPEEIAISILAEPILTKRTLRPDHIAPSDADLDVIARPGRSTCQPDGPKKSPGHHRGNQRLNPSESRSKYDRV